MSLLTICQEAAGMVPITIPNSIVGNTSETALLLLSVAQAEGKALKRRCNWLSLATEHTFSTVVDQEDYSLPSDFEYLINQTLWDKSNFEHIRGPLSAQQWQEHKSSILASTNTTWKRFRIRNVSGTDKFSIFPTPDSIDSMVFEYASSNWCESALGVGSDKWVADSDTGIIPEYLIELGVKWRLLNRLGMAYDEEKEEYDREVSSAIARDGGAPVLNITTQKRYNLIGIQNIPDSGYG